MFDTVRLQATDVELDLAKLEAMDWSDKLEKDRNCGVVKERVSWHPKKVKGATPGYLSYVPAGNVLVTECSLPKLMYGQNATLLRTEDVGPALDRLSNRIDELTGGQCPRHVGDWTLRGRLDPVFSWTANDMLPEYILSLAHREIARHKVGLYPRQTVKWQNEQRVLQAYDKHAECGIDQARGQLRFECQLHHGKAELEAVGLSKSLRAKDILTWDISSALLRKYLGEIKAELMITNEQRLIKQLLKTFASKPRGKATVARLYGMAAMLDLFGAEYLKSQGYDRSAIWRSKKQIDALGVSLGYSELGMLPPLALPSTYDGQPGELGPG